MPEGLDLDAWINQPEEEEEEEESEEEEEEERVLGGRAFLREEPEKKREVPEPTLQVREEGLGAGSLRMLLLSKPQQMMALPPMWGWVITSHRALEKKSLFFGNSRAKGLQ